MYKILNVLHYLCVVITGVLTYVVIENPNDKEMLLYLAITIITAIGYRRAYLYVKEEKEESEYEYEEEDVDDV